MYCTWLACSSIPQHFINCLPSIICAMKMNVVYMIQRLCTLASFRHVYICCLVLNVFFVFLSFSVLLLASSITMIYKINCAILLFKSYILLPICCFTLVSYKDLINLLKLMFGNQYVKFTIILAVLFILLITICFDAAHRHTHDWNNNFNIGKKAGIANTSENFNCRFVYLILSL